MTERDRYLLKQGYECGYLNASLAASNGLDVMSHSPEQEAEMWVDEVIADNGVTVGEHICHQAPNT